MAASRRGGLAANQMLASYRQSEAATQAAFDQLVEHLRNNINQPTNVIGVPDYVVVDQFGDRETTQQANPDEAAKVMSHFILTDVVEKFEGLSEPAVILEEPTNPSDGLDGEGITVSYVCGLSHIVSIEFEPAA